MTGIRTHDCTVTKHRRFLVKDFRENKIGIGLGVDFCSKISSRYWLLSI